LNFQQNGEKMKGNYPILRKCRLFTGISQADLMTMLGCLPVKQKRFNKGSYVLNAGEKAGFAGIVLSGSVHVLTDNPEGKRKIIGHIGSGGLFAEAFVCANVEKLPVSVIAAEETEVLFIDGKRISSTCSPACVYHISVIRNLTKLLAEKNIALLEKLEFITQTTTREKLLSYLSNEAKISGKTRFNIPFNREELAHYLAVDRSGLSAELSKMQNEGLIRYHGKQFELLPACNAL